MNQNKYDLIAKEINDLLNSKKKSSTKQRAALQYISNLGHLPVVINHLQYNQNKFILFMHDEMLFSIIIFESEYLPSKIEYCTYSPIEELKDLDINSEADQIKFNQFLKKQCVFMGFHNYFNCFCLDTTYTQTIAYKKLCKESSYANNKHKEYEKNYLIYKNYDRSTQLLHIFFEK